MPPRLSIIVFDVNETLSDMTPLAVRFTNVGVPGLLAAEWFASVLRDGFALTATGGKAAFAQLTEGALRMVLSGSSLNQPVDEAVEHIMSGFTKLDVYPDVPQGISVLRDRGYRLVTLSNGSAEVADRLLITAGLRQDFERLMSADDAQAWKPAAAAYSHAGRVCRASMDQMMLVAVHPWDIHGACQAGMRTGWINRQQAPYPDYFAAPDLRATSLVDLAARIAG